MTEMRKDNQPSSSDIILYQTEDGRNRIEATVKDFLTVRREGSRDVQRRLEHYNLSQELFGERGAGVPPARKAAGTAAPHCRKD